MLRPAVCRFRQVVGSSFLPFQKKSINRLMRALSTVFALVDSRLFAMPDEQLSLIRCGIRGYFLQAQGSLMPRADRLMADHIISYRPSLFF